MTNEQLSDDLKQFIDARLSQEMATVATRDDLQMLATKDDLQAMETRLDARIDTLDEKVDLIHDAIAESVTQRDVRLDDHERRLVRLERRSA